MIMKTSTEKDLTEFVVKAIQENTMTGNEIHNHIPNLV